VAFPASFLPKSSSSSSSFSSSAFWFSLGVPREKKETHANDFDPIWRAGLWRPFRAHRLELTNPGLKPWAENWSPFREKICTASLMLTRMCRRRTRRNASTIKGAAPELNHRASCRGSRGSASLPSPKLIVKPRASSPNPCRYDRSGSNPNLSN
jgi:hypothetical protein